jgi:Holliday junction resolvase RusA-like endonuclease
MIAEFSIRGKLRGMNEIARKHHNVYSREKKTEQETIAWEIVRQKVAHFRGPVAVSFHWWEPDDRRDPDNVCAGQKVILDAMVAMKVIKNDSQEYVKELYHHFHLDAHDPRIEVVIHSLGGD